LELLKIIPQKTNTKDIHNAAIDAFKNKQSNYLFECYQLPHYINNKIFIIYQMEQEEVKEFLLHKEFTMK